MQMFISAGSHGISKHCLHEASSACGPDSACHHTLQAPLVARVRVEAAMALGRTAGPATQWAGLDHLLKACRARAMDPATQQPRPRYFASLAEFFVDQARRGLCCLRACMRQCVCWLREG